MWVYAICDPCHKGRAMGILAPCHFLSHHIGGTCWSPHNSQTWLYVGLFKLVGSMTFLRLDIWRSVWACWPPSEPGHTCRVYDYVDPMPFPRPFIWGGGGMSTLAPCHCQAQPYKEASGMLAPMPFQSPVLWVVCFHIVISHPGHMLLLFAHAGPRAISEPII